MNINECGCRPYGWLGLDGNRCIRVIPRHLLPGGGGGRVVSAPRGVCSRGGVSAPGVSALGGGCLVLGGCVGIPARTEADTPPLTE